MPSYSGVWNLVSQMQAVAAGNWPAPPTPLWAWGRNDFGQLGLGDTTSRSSPVQVDALNSWISVAAGKYFSVAVKTNGTLWSWGLNNNGQLGLGNTTYYSSPKQVGALTSWYSVRAGDFCMIAPKTDGTLWSWGRGALHGQLGLGNVINYSSPKQIGGLSNWVLAETSFQSVLSLKTP